MPKISSKKLEKLYLEKVKILKRLEELEVEEREERNKIVSSWNTKK